MNQLESDVHIFGLAIMAMIIAFMLLDRRRRKSVEEFEARRKRKTMSPCPVNDTHLTSPFSSTQQLWCHDCRKHYAWPLKPGQSPLITDSRDKGMRT